MLQQLQGSTHFMASQILQNVVSVLHRFQLYFQLKLLALVKIWEASRSSRTTTWGGHVYENNQKCNNFLENFVYTLWLLSIRGCRSFLPFLQVQNTKAAPFILDIFPPITKWTRNKAWFGCVTNNRFQLSAVSTLTPLQPNPNCSLPFRTYSSQNLPWKGYSLGELVSLAPPAKLRYCPGGLWRPFCSLPATALQSQAMHRHSTCTTRSLLPALLGWVLYRWKTTLTARDSCSSGFHSKFCQRRFSNVTVMI